MPGWSTRVPPGWSSASTTGRTSPSGRCGRPAGPISRSPSRPTAGSPSWPCTTPPVTCSPPPRRCHRPGEPVRPGARRPGRAGPAPARPAPHDRVLTCAAGAGHRGKLVRYKKGPVAYRRGMTVRSTPAGGPGLPQERRLVTEIPGPLSRELLARRQAAVARGVSHVLPVFIAAAGGGVLVDADGNSLIDFGSGIAVTSVGNSAPRLVERVRYQAGQFTHTCFMVTPYEGYVAVCEKLAEHTPGDHDKRSALFNSGAEAVENAVKIARHATGRQAVVAFDHAYHGRTNLTMALTAKNMPYKDKFGPFAGEIYRVPMAYP